MTEKICKNCRWWTLEYHLFMCHNPKLGKGDESNDGVVFEMGNVENLETGPNFGCIHWESKEGEIL